MTDGVVAERRPEVAGALTGWGGYGEVRVMNDERAELSRLVGAVLARFFAQNGRVVPTDTERADCGARLWAVVVERGLPRALAPGEGGAPGGMSEEDCAPLVARVLGGAGDPLLGHAVKQLVKACFYPEFTECRNSFREVATDGGCRRQELNRVLGRVSGAHCVDCPHWVALAPAAHENYLASQWRSTSATFAPHRDVFLPEDFRALRRWLHTATRKADAPPPVAPPPQLNPEVE